LTVELDVKLYQKIKALLPIIEEKLKTKDSGVVYVNQNPMLCSPFNVLVYRQKQGQPVTVYKITIPSELYKNDALDGIVSFIIANIHDQQHQ